MRPWLALMAALVVGAAFTAPAGGQTSSLGKRAQPDADNAPASAAGSSRETLQYQGNPVLEASSLIAVPVVPPKEFRNHDIITIIVRQQKKFEADGELQSKKKFEVQSTVDAFFKIFDQGVGASVFRRGKPNVDYEFESRVKNQGDATREDSFVTRVSGFIVDVKPNGNLVIEARGRIKHDEEVALVTVTGVARSADVTPDNTILSTQLADLSIEVKNSGAVRDASSRGWITRLLDYAKPI